MRKFNFELIIILFICLYSSCSDGIDKIIKDRYSDGTPKEVEYIKDGDLLKKEMFYKNGKKEIEYIYDDSLRYTFWDKQSILLEKGIFTLDESKGKRIRFNKSVIELENFISDGRVDTTVYYYPNGKKKLEIKVGKHSNKAVILSWYESGVLESEKNELGKKITYYENGLKKTLSYTVDDLKEGLWSFWNERGELTKQETWEKGELKETKKYDEEGN